MSFLFRTRDTEMLLEDSGFFSSVKIRGTEVILRHSPIVSLCVEDGVFLPEKAVKNGETLTVFTKAGEVSVKCGQNDTDISFEIIAVPENAYAVVLGPVAVTLAETVGEVIGVVSGGGLSFGAQALNIKTVEGYPSKYTDKMVSLFGYRDSTTGITVSNIDISKRAAVLTENGAVLQFSCRRRDIHEKLEVCGVKDCLVFPLAQGDPDSVIAGAKIAYFGCKTEDALDRIGEIELENGLPHPIIEGEWVKKSRGAMRSYLISDFSAESFGFVLEKAEKAGLKYVYHPGPQKNWGHFEWNDEIASDNAEARKLTDEAARRGISVGVHTLTNFTTVNDPYVSPVPSEHLLKMCEVSVERETGEEDTEIVISQAEQFTHPLTLNTVQIENELITYGEYAEKDGFAVLSSCVRGAFGTVASSHPRGAVAYRLWDYPYRTLFPDIILQDEYSDNIGRLFRECGLKQISFDGLEGCSYTGHDNYATTRFVYNCWKHFDNDVINDASRLQHFNWHIHSRMNWGEPWGEAMRTGQVDGRIRNQAFFRRNLFPRMLGWFLIRLADKKFECSTLEDIEWALSEAAGFDGGYAMTINVATLKKHGRIDELLAAMKYWDELRYKNAFTEEQKARLRLPETEWHLEKNGDGSYSLYPLWISKRFTCALSELQPGQPGGSDWTVENPYHGSASVRINIEGEGSVRDIMIKTAKSTVKFNCEIEDGQYIILSRDGNAEITDRNYNTVKTVTPQGELIIPEGFSALSFSCGHSINECPDVTVRFITRGKPETVEP